MRLKVKRQVYCLSFLFVSLYIPACLPKHKTTPSDSDQKKASTALDASGMDIQEPLNKNLVQEQSLNLQEDIPIVSSAPEDKEDQASIDPSEIPEDLKDPKLYVEPEKFTLGHLYQTSNLVIRGVTKNIDYRVSEPNAQGFRAPLTFVTFRIEKIFKGRFSGKEITIKFVGGPVGGVFSTSEQTPLFNLNDEDILFIEGNNRLFTPIPHLSRARIIDGHVYSEVGTKSPSPLGGFLPEDLTPKSIKKVNNMIIEVVRSESIGEDGSPIQRDTEKLSLKDYEHALQNLNSQDLQLTAREIEVSLNPNQDLTVPSL